MMRTIEVIIVIAIIFGAYIAVSTYTALPWPREVSPMNLNRLSLTTMELLDNEYSLSLAAFDTNNVTCWSQLQIALSASLPANVVYNLTVYEVASGTGSLYTAQKSISNAESLGISSDASSYMVSSANVTFNFTPQKIGAGSGGGTLYILNCNDANGWWITGYTAQSLAEDFYKMLSNYFVRTIMVNNTAQLEKILYGIPLDGENVQNAVIINTFGEAVPIPLSFCNSTYSNGRYCYFLGQKTNLYNWTWCSIVGYPFYYISNTVGLNGTGDQNTYGIYGMRCVAASGSRGFLQGLRNTSAYNSGDNGDITDWNTYQASLTPTAVDACNYYGLYPYPTQWFNRALDLSILSGYGLTTGFDVFTPFGNIHPGRLYNHVSSGTITGSFLALGLTGMPDIRLVALSLLSYYQPSLYRSQYDAGGTSRVVILQLGLVGGI